jgi:GrpB-like predicted nucleotidyltransferase (UPF0157 family)
MQGEKIIIQDYDPKWIEQFETIEALLILNLKNQIIKIEHIGSTSVPGMKAKPIIDLDIVIEDDNNILKIVISKLGNLGYIHLGEMGISGREAFKRVSSQSASIGSKEEWFEHNLYVCKKDSVGLINHLTLRNYLNENPIKVIEYSNLKKELVKKFPYDIDSYVDGKTDFILKILKENGVKSSDTELIEIQNRLRSD